MDLSSAAKKRKADENGGAGAASPHPSLTLDDAQKLIANFSPEELRSIVASSLLESPSVLAAVRTVADMDPAERKLFIRGLGWDTTSDSLRAVFLPFGEIKEAIVICEKATGKSKGYGFVTFVHADSALLALKEPSKKIDGRVTVSQLASVGNTGAGPAAVPAAVGGGAAAQLLPDASQRKIFVGNVPHDMPSDRLLAIFSSFGEIEEGPVGLDKLTGKFKGYALFVYKTVDGARAAIAEPKRMIDGNLMEVRLAIDGKKKPGMGENKPAPGVESNKQPGEGFGGGFGSLSSMPGSLGNQFGGPGSGYSSYGGFFPSGGSGLPAPGALGNHHLNSPLQSSIGSGMSGQVPSAMGGTGIGSFGSGGGAGGFGGPYGSSSQFSGGPGVPGGYGGLGVGMGSSLYNRFPPSSGVMGSGGFSESGPYLMPSMGHSGQHHQSVGSPPGPRIPSGSGMFQGMPPYY